jgi:phage tail sheath gpL-like
MALAFRYFPAPMWRPSGFYAEFNPSQANTAIQLWKALLIGQKLPSGSAVADTPVLAYSTAQVAALCGPSSMLALMYAAYRKQDPQGECWILPVSDNPAGATATGGLTFTGSAAVSGTFPLYVMGVPVPVGVNAGDTAPTLATNTVAAVNNTPGICVTAAVASGNTSQVTFTALHKGLALNDVDIRIAYYGAAAGEQVPTGITAAIAPMSGGTTNPTLTNALANLGVQQFDFIALPYTDTISLNALQSFLSDSAGRWSAEEMLYGHVFSAFRGTLGARATFGNSRNDQHASILGYYDSPTPAWLEAADWAAVHALRIKVNPAVGVTGMALGLLPPPVASQDTSGERNTMLFDGISTFTVDESQTCRIDRSITTYQFNPSGQPDDSYLSTNIMFQATFVARYMDSQLTSQFIDAGLILVDDGTPIGPGSPATTPSLVLQAAIAIYGYLCTEFIVQDADAFAKAATASKGAKGQVLLYLPLNFSDQLIQIAALFQFTQTT